MKKKKLFSSRRTIASILLVLAVGMVLLIVLLPGKDSEWKFIVYGDTRTDEENHKRVLSSMVENTPDYQFIVNVGDVAQRGQDTLHWNMWERAVNEVLGSTGQRGKKRYYVATGNHEAILRGGLDNWQAYLKGQYKDYESTNGLYFTFDYKNVRMIVVNCFGDIAKQKAMIEEAAASNPHPWLFAAWHKPIFVYGNKVYEEVLHNELGKTLYENGCDILFTGHSHMYVRSKKLPLNGEKHPPLDEKNGTVQVITGNGGVPMRQIPIIDADGNGYLVAENAYNMTTNQFGYTEIEINGDESFTLRHILIDGTVFDTETYTPNKKPNMK